jgi:hypothetical protein
MKKNPAMGQGGALLSDERKDATSDRMSVLMGTRATIERAACEAIVEGLHLASIVVVVLDLDDPTAADFARSTGRDAGEIKRRFAEGKRPILAIVVPIAKALEFFYAARRGVARDIASPLPANSVRAVVIASAGAFVAAVPLRVATTGAPS